jgi:hypothetical protein
MHILKGRTEFLNITSISCVFQKVLYQVLLYIITNELWRYKKNIALFITPSKLEFICDLTVSKINKAL